MGVVGTISATRWPKQGPHLGRSVQVCFDYDMTVTLAGRVVRDDYEEPWVTLIEMEGGRYVLATECQYSVPS